MKTYPRFFSFQSFSIALLFLEILPGISATIVVPNSLATVEGNSGDPYPFLSIANTVRYQEVFDASQFSGINPGGGMIVGFLLRGDSPGSPFGFAATIPSLQIDFSTTAKAPDGLSTVFADNVGPDKTVVLGGTISFSSVGSGIAPHPFAVNIPFSTPFYYNPESGNLLMDVRNFSGQLGTIGAQFDAQDTLGDSVSRVYAASTIPNNGVDAISGLKDSKGLIIDFVVTPVPEPSSFSLFLLGAIAIGFCLWQGRRREGGTV